MNTLQGDRAPLIERLERPGLSMSEVMTAVRHLEEQEPSEKPFTFGITANITLDVLETYLLRQALLDGYRAAVLWGLHGDHAGNVSRFADSPAGAVLVWSFFDNVLPSLESRIPTLKAAAIDAMVERTREETRLVLEAGSKCKQIYLMEFHRFGLPSAIGLTSRVDAVIKACNGVMNEVADRFTNVRVLRPSEIVSTLGWENALSRRNYCRYRAPYTTAFFEEFARQLSAATRAGGTRYSKALVLDADGTLWGGILGEDLENGIRLDPHTSPGNIYWTAQQEFLALKEQGVLLALCSRNERLDVEKVLREHPAMVIRAKDFAATEINWDNKASNIRKIASTLNLGLDSLVFLDDSAFECEAVRRQLPAVRTVRVPENVFDYPAVISELRELFLGGGQSTGNSEKTEQYRIRALAEEERSRHRSQDEYLASLGMRLEIRENERPAARRVAELTQKTNQFNLTTIRHSEGEILNLMNSPGSAVYSLHLSDKFGDSGLTGVLIILLGNEEANVESFLLSCRILGRGVEFAAWPPVLERVQRKGVRKVRAEYRPTAKNVQTSEFFDRLGLALLHEENGHKHYEADLSNLSVTAPPCIEVIHEF